jgi:peptidoglycan/xylan/chitin deacetylase (PgdA/CDA1 family)
VVSALRNIAKSLAYGVAGALAPLVLRTLRGPRLLVLTYHRVLPADHPARAYEQPGMIVSPETLAMNIRVLRQHFELLHIEDWVERVRTGAPLPRLACALTFDDGWRDNYDHAFPVLQAAQAPATIYLVSDLVGTARGYWPTRLARLLCQAWRSNDMAPVQAFAAQCPAVTVPLQVAPGSEIVAADAVLDALKPHYSDAQLSAAVTSALGDRVASEPVDLMDWEQIAEMEQSGLLRFGSHTRTHTRLRAGIDAALLKKEVDGSLAELSARLQRPVTGFCYPNGDYCPEAVRQVGSSYHYAVSTHRGWNTAQRNRLFMNRLTVQSNDGLKGRLLARCLITLSGQTEPQHHD